MHRTVRELRDSGEASVGRGRENFTIAVGGGINTRYSSHISQAPAWSILSFELVNSQAICQLSDCAIIRDE